MLESQLTRGVVAGAGAPAAPAVRLHPTPILSIADHQKRCQGVKKKRVVGCLLGETRGGELHVTDAFALPFEELPAAADLWYADLNYLTKMAKMFRKVNPRDVIVGWYSTARAVRANDAQINELFREHVANPLLVLLHVGEQIEIQTFFSFDPSRADRQRRFLRVPYEFAAEIAEEVAVEHLVKNVRHSYEAFAVSECFADVRTALGAFEEGLAKLIGRLEALRAQPEQLSMPRNRKLVLKIVEFINEIPKVSCEEALEESVSAEVNYELASSFLAYSTRLTVQLQSLIKSTKSAVRA